MPRRAVVALALAGVFTLAPHVAHAGRSCEAKPPTVESVREGLSLALATAQALDASGARVVVLARIGQDLSRHGLRYSHLGFAYQDHGRWRVAHKLNHCGTAEGAVYRQGLGEFFLDDLHRYEAAAVVLSPEVQDRLLAVLTDDQRLTRLHEPAYSMVAYPWSQRYQQSNQWAIETMALAMAPEADNRARAQAWLQLQGYEPTPLKLGPITRLGARATAANAAFDDHPNDKRYADRIETITVDSVFHWLDKRRLGAQPVTIRATPATAPAKP